MKAILNFAAAFLLSSSSTSYAQSQDDKLQACSPTFLSDYSQVSSAVEQIIGTLTGSLPAENFRAALMSGLNACHTFVENHVQVDPHSNRWGGVTCAVISEGDQLQVIEPRSHKAECEYLQRLMDSEESSRNH